MTSIQLPTLQGSEKQIKWANDIRKAAIENGNYFIGRELLPEKRQMAISAFEQVFASHAHAAWWIDNRRFASEKIAQEAALIFEQAVNEQARKLAQAAYDEAVVVEEQQPMPAKKPARKQDRSNLDVSFLQNQQPASSPLEEDEDEVPPGHCPNCFNHLWDKSGQCKVCGYAPTYTIGG